MQVYLMVVQKAMVFLFDKSCMALAMYMGEMISFAHVVILS